MGTCFFISLIIISITLFVKIFNPFMKNKKISHKLPPGPPTFPFFGNLLWLLIKPLPQIKALSLSLRERYSPIYTLYIGSKPLIFIANHSLAHQALIANGAITADLPKAMATDKLLSCDQHNITLAFYGPTWLHLRRNLTSNILNPSRLTSFTECEWIVDKLIDCLKSLSSSNEYHQVDIMEHIQHAVFSMFASICFREKLEDKKIQDIKDVQLRLKSSFEEFKVLNVFPSLGKFVFHKRWEKLRQIRQEQEKIMVPLIRARKDKHGRVQPLPFVPYVDTLFDLQLIEENRKLEEKEIVTLCSELFTAGTDTTFTALEWIMANLVKHPHMQHKLFNEIKGVVLDRDQAVIIKEEDLGKMPYLRAVILEGLRRHPPTHFLIPHSVTRDIVLGDFLVPKDSIIIFMVAEMGQDPNVWENPMEFKPERFLKDFDINGTKEIKMMPFGVGARMCPAYRMAMLRLKYFVANLIWHFNFDPSEGVDLSEKHEFTTVMQNPLQVQITPRF